MNKLNIPFKQNKTLLISENKSNLKVYTEFGSTDIEIFQALNYRNKKDFIHPLTLKFSNPLVQSFVKINFDFTVELIAIDYLNNKVKKVQIIHQNKTKGDFIQGFSEYSLVILAPKGFCKKNGIKENTTIIKLK